jgi:hypothetical protein
MRSHSPSAAPEPPLRYTIDPAARTITVELLAIDDELELLAALQRIPRDPAFRPGFNVYVDCNSLRRIPSCEDVKRLARLCVACPRPGAPSRWALIATWRPIFEAARFFATAVSAPNVSLRVFHALSDARMWFAVTAPAPDSTAAEPWVGPSPVLNELVRRSRVAGA